jgi:hypothetical protein
MNDIPTEAEIAAAANTLQRLQPGFLPLPIFLAITRLSVVSAIELIPLRMLGNKVQVLLTKRPDDDPNWPGMLHIPGTILRATDSEGSTYGSAFKRLYDDELANVQLAGEPQLVEFLLHKVRRGVEDAKVFFVEVTGEPTTGSFYDVDNLPDTIVDTQISYIRSSAEQFRAGAGQAPKNFGNDPLDVYSQPVAT